YLVRARRRSIGENIGDGDQSLLESERAVECRARFAFVIDREQRDVGRWQVALPVGPHGRPAKPKAEGHHVEKRCVVFESRQADLRCTVELETEWRVDFHTEAGGLDGEELLQSVELLSLETVDASLCALPSVAVDGIN